MVTPDDLLGPRVQGTVRLEDGREVEVSARPRKDGGFTDRTMISFKPAGKRGTSGLRVELLRWFAEMEITAPPRTPLMRAVAALEARGCEPKWDKAVRNYYANCPAHDGGSSSLLVTVIERGLVFTCRSATCTTEDILAALGLSTSDLLPDEDQNPGPVMGFSVPLTMRDARTVLDWLASQGEWVSW